MAEIIEEMTIAATPESVFQALTRSEGIAAWWSNHVTAKPELGSITEVSFENGGIFQLEVIALEVGQKVHWRVKLSPHDWEGSTITWDMTAIPSGTQMLFGQHNLEVGPTGYRIEDTQAGWRYFLFSLKAYLETGTGTPYVY